MKKKKENLTKRGKPKKKVGRKLFDGKDYNVVIAKLEQAWKIGCTDSEAAAHAGISKPALCIFLSKNPIISEQKQAFLENPIISARLILHQSINKGNADLAFKYLERKRHEEFGPKQKIEMSGGLDVADEELSDDISELNNTIKREITAINKITKEITGKQSKKKV